MNQEDAIISHLLRGKSVVVVGPSNAGKTHWIHTALIPRLKGVGRSVAYNVNGSGIDNAADITVFDEAETLFDADHLQEKSHAKPPYYSEEYLARVKEWREVYVQHPEPSAYIISRNEGDVQYLVDNFKLSDWDGRDIKVFRFPLDD